MSFVIFPNHGVNDNDPPYALSIKTSLAGFQYAAFASGVVATPASPNAACLASGLIVRKGTAVVIGLKVVSAPVIVWAIANGVISNVQTTIKQDFMCFFFKGSK